MMMIWNLILVLSKKILPLILKKEKIIQILANVKILYYKIKFIIIINGKILYKILLNE
jgi:hypothetical protein